MATKEQKVIVQFTGDNEMTVQCAEGKKVTDTFKLTNTSIQKLQSINYQAFAMHGEESLESFIENEITSHMQNNVPHLSDAVMMVVVKHTMIGFK